MNRIAQCFAAKPKDLLSIYLTAGYPKLEDTGPLIESLEAAGVDLIEIGMPYSDPLADGPVIQACHQQALENGMTLRNLLAQVTEVRPRVKMPLILMSYLNPILRYGISEFCEAAAKAGIDGLIVPDLPLEVYRQQYKSAMEKHGLEMIFLITPNTPTERIRAYDAEGNGFIYAVSTTATTGLNKGISQDYLARLAGMQLCKPFLVGFGISNAADFAQANVHAAGAIVGTAFLKAIADVPDLDFAAQSFALSLRNISHSSISQNQLS
jgi:tryptophan synthase alpha chain